MPKINKKEIRGWLAVEDRIKKEILWLQNVVDVFSTNSKNNTAQCDRCALRNIALLIGGGQIEAKEIRRHPRLKSFWKPLNNDHKKLGRYAGRSDWHKSTIRLIENHFIAHGFRVAREPEMTHGRADLLIFKKNQQNLFVEIGTISSFMKLYLNLKRLPNRSLYLLVPGDDLLIEFIKK